LCAFDAFSVTTNSARGTGIVQNLLNTDPFLGAHYTPFLYEFEPASPDKALEGCLKVLDTCQVYLLIIGSQYGTLVGNLSITHAEYRRANDRKLPVLAFIKGERSMRREPGTDGLLKELDADGPASLATPRRGILVFC
jgi:ATP-dependent DNA helicase RecG